jgi:hypothetical protein
MATLSSVETGEKAPHASENLLSDPLKRVCDQQYAQTEKKDTR